MLTCIMVFQSTSSGLKHLADVRLSLFAFHLLFYYKEIDVRVADNDFAFPILSFALRCGICLSWFFALKVAL